jgi:hypothetical protein
VEKKVVGPSGAFGFWMNSPPDSTEMCRYVTANGPLKAGEVKTTSV